MPYPDRHVCELRRVVTVRAIGHRDQTHEGKRYHVLSGIPRVGREAVSAEYEYQYPADEWTAAEARNHCVAHSGIGFHIATGNKVEEAAKKLKKAMEK